MNITNPYIAGFIDGEGYIGLLRRNRKDLIQGFYYKPVIKVSQRSLYSKVLYLFQEKYGGYITVKAKQPHLNQKQVDAWEIANRPMVKKVLLDIQEYSLVKREIIDLMLEFIELPIRNTRDSHIHDERKAEIYAELRALNKRGLAETN